MENYIGLDAHSQTSTFVTLNTMGQEINQLQVATTEVELVTYLRSLSGKKILTFEESTLAKWLYLKLKPEVEEILVCNPSLVSKKRGAKTDYLDAKHLARELRAGNLVAVFHDEQNEFLKLRIQVKSYLDLGQDIKRTQNRLKAIFRSEAKPTTGRTLYSSPERTSELSRTAKFSADILFAQYRSQMTNKEIYFSAFRDNMKTFSIIRRLATLPGVDLVRANIIAAIVADGRRFKNKHVFWSYCSLVSRERVSDGKSYGVEKVRGSSELKSVFMGAATSVIQHESSLRNHYEELCANGLDSRKAKKAIVRKVAAIALSIMKNDIVYEDNFMEKQKRKLKARF